MPRRTHQGDPIAAQARRAGAQRRVGIDAKCECGEDRPEALIRKESDIACAACTRKRKGKTAVDNHHVAGKANSPVAIPIPVNDHRARLSVDQYDWPKKTLENVDRSPLLAAAACIRGFINTVIYLADKVLSWIAEMLELLDEHLIECWGSQWWLNTKFKKFTPGVVNAKN
jgi:hypothetical protein